jgi:hypothetical protein
MAVANSPETAVTNDGCTWHLTEGVNVRKREFSDLSGWGMAGSVQWIAEWHLLLVIYCENKPTTPVYMKGGEKNKQ